MVKKLGILVFISGLFICLYFYMHRDRGRELDESRTVYIKKLQGINQLYRNGEPFYIKGASGTSYLKELSEAGGNTLRVYDTINLKSILDEAKKYDLAVVVDIYLPTAFSNEDYYSDAENIKQLKKRIRGLVQKYKEHSSLLIWNLGNEINYPLGIDENPFVNVFNDLVDLIHQEDPDHLISTSISGTSHSQTLGLLLNSPKIDLIGFNAFGSLPRLQSTIDQVGYITNIKPYYITEWGIHGPWEAPWNLWWSAEETSSTEKGDEYEKIYNDHIKTNLECLGSLVFYWGYKHEGTPTWFNIFDEEGRKSEAYYSLKSVWKDEKILEKKIPKIEDLQLLSSGRTDQIVMQNTIIDAQLYLKFPIDSTYSFKWNLYKEAWGYQNWKVENDSFKIEQFTSKTSNSVKFPAPKEDGPYRLVVSVNDAQGNFATANMPFYVLSTQ